MKQVISFIFFVLWTLTCGAQFVQKTIPAQRITESIKIDGELEEVAWKSAIPASNFIQFDPVPSSEPTYQTEVKIIYDDEAIYFGATMYDDESDKILTQLSERDDSGNTDWFAVILDTYQDGLNAFGFYVTAAGVQRDIRYAGGNEDSNWDAVWESDMKITDQGWVVEIRIPYSAIRFSSEAEQEWNIQFFREIRRFREQSSWNVIDPAIDNVLAQAGKLTGIENIESPVRLSFTPFVAGYLNHSNYDIEGLEEWSSAYNAGMDVKYGINDAFTLDMTLIPDFGQVLSDQQILNLTPFEVFFEENRQFFTEGIDLFNKAGLFYTRRVGSRPLNYSRAFAETTNNEQVIENPDITSLYNATKISGRNAQGTGLGFFNAVAAEEYAILENIITGEQREIKTNPLTNYNVVVIDQNLKNNSFISFVNTNVMRDGSSYDANVTGGEFNFKTSDQRFGINGSGAVSQRYFTNDTDIGHKFNLGLGKYSGNWTYGVGYNEESDNYNPNDLGFLFAPNERNLGANLSYTNYDPGGRLNRYTYAGAIEYARLYDPNEFVNLALRARGFYLFKSRLAFGGFVNYEPIDSYDFFEPRTIDFSRSYRFPKNWLINSFVSTDYRKTFALDANISYRKFDADGRQSMELGLEPRIRFNDRWSMIHSWSISKRDFDEGYVDKAFVPFSIEDVSIDDILFGKRNRTIITNTLSTNYIFTNNMALTLRVRHYYDQVRYQSFGTLQNDGRVSTINFNGQDENGRAIFDRNVNFFNVDLNYTWRFAPGSDIIFNWKNQIFASDDNYEKNYLSNLTGLFDENQSNSLSIRIVYFLDYLYLK